MAGTQGRRWAVALMVVDVALLVVLAVLALGHFQSTPGDDDSPSPSTAAVDDAVDFRMPSGNVACHMDDAGVVCGMKNVKIWPKVEGCAGDHVVVLDGAGARSVCAAAVDVPLPAGASRADFGGAYFPSNAAQLAYEQSVSVGDYTCQSREAGVLCSNTAGQWFNLRMQDGLTKGESGDDPP